MSEISIYDNILFLDGAGRGDDMHLREKSLSQFFSHSQTVMERFFNHSMTQSERTV